MTKQPGASSSAQTWSLYRQNCFKCITPAHERRLENMKPTPSAPHQHPNQPTKEVHSAPHQGEGDHADSVGNTPGFKDLEDAIKRVKNPAQSPSDRTGELLLEEAEMTEIAIPTPAGTKRSTRRTRG